MEAGIADYVREMPELTAEKKYLGSHRFFDRGLRIRGVMKGLRIAFKILFGGVIIAVGLSSPGFGFTLPTNAKAIGSDLLSVFLYCGSAYILCTGIGEMIKGRKPHSNSSSPQ